MAKGKKKDPKDAESSSAPRKPVQVKLKINLWTVVGVILVIFFVLPVIITGLQMLGSKNKVDISQVLVDIKSQKVDKVLIESDKLVVNYKDGSVILRDFRIY